jgi:hypothetical protein
MAVERLFRQETNLRDADVTLQFATTQLEKLSSELGKTLAVALSNLIFYKLATGCSESVYIQLYFNNL